MSDFAIQDLLPVRSDYEKTGSALFYEIEKKPWNSNLTVKDTVACLVRNSVLGYSSLLENCRIVAASKEQFRGKNVSKPIEEIDGEWKERYTDDWNRLKKILIEDLSYTEKSIEQMTKIWESSRELNGGLKYVFENSLLVDLPDTISALYEISTLKSDVPANKEKLAEIVGKIRKDKTISINEIRKIKARKTKEKEVDTKKNPDASIIRLPPDISKLEVLKSKWSELNKHVQAINDLNLGIEISFDETPEKLIEKIKKADWEKENRSEINKTLNKFRNYTKKYAKIKNPSDILHAMGNSIQIPSPINFFDEEPDQRAKEMAEFEANIKNESKERQKAWKEWKAKSKSLGKRREEAKECWESVKKLKLEDKCQKIIDEWEEEVRLRNELDQKRNSEMTEETKATFESNATNPERPQSEWEKATMETSIKIPPSKEAETA